MNLVLVKLAWINIAAVINNSKSPLEFAISESLEIIAFKKKELPSIFRSIKIRWFLR